jgi:DNA-binding response OmpR family regulator
MKPGTKILIVEDDKSIARLLEMELGRRGYSARSAHDGEVGLEAVGRFRPDAIVLDILLPKLDGVGVLRRLRRDGDATPVVMLTARDATLDKVHGLKSGADDYLAKPFDTEELVARLEAVLRRVQGEEVLRVGDLEINTATREVTRGDRDIELTAREYSLLEFLAKNPRRVMSREVLLSRVWEQDAGVMTNVVDVYVGYLRKKVDAPGEGRMIQTVRGVGYSMGEG